MFYYISGALVLNEPGCAVIDAGGVAYKMNISYNTFSRLAGKDKALLYTYMAVKEDGVDLYGFFDKEELSVYKLLITVSGVGPKAAMSVLSTMTPEKLAFAVATGDTKSISSAPGLGPKTAARIVLELKDKLAKQVGTGNDAPISSGSELSDAQNALLVLGYTRAEASKALGGFNSAGMELEDIIKEALKKLM